MRQICGMKGLAAFSCITPCRAAWLPCCSNCLFAVAPPCSLPELPELPLLHPTPPHPTPPHPTPPHPTPPHPFAAVCHAGGLNNIPGEEKHTLKRDALQKYGLFSQQAIESQVHILADGGALRQVLPPLLLLLRQVVPPPAAAAARRHCRHCCCCARRLAWPLPPQHIAHA